MSSRKLSRGRTVGAKYKCRVHGMCPGMSAPVLTMSKQEFERAVLLRKVLDKRLTQCKAAEILGLSLRQVERLCRRYRTAGPAALATRRRGRASNHQVAASLRDSVLGLVRARYADFGPTLAREKLLECHGRSRWRKDLLGGFEIQSWYGCLRKDHIVGQVCCPHSP